MVDTGGLCVTDQSWGDAAGGLWQLGLQGSQLGDC